MTWLIAKWCAMCKNRRISTNVSLNSASLRHSILFRHRHYRGGHWGPTLSSKYVQIEHSGETTSATIEKRDGLRVREKRIAILLATNRNPSVSFYTGTFIKLDSKGTEDCGCNLRKQHGVCVCVRERRGEKETKQSIWNAQRGWFDRRQLSVEKRREVTVHQCISRRVLIVIMTVPLRLKCIRQKDTSIE